MADNKCQYQGSGGYCTGKENVCVDVSRVMDSCRDKDCFENAIVHLTDGCADLLDRITSLRANSAEIVGANIYVDPVAFNRGFYQVSVRYYIKVTVEGCIGPRAQLLEGITAVEKRAILYGGEGCAHVFRSGATANNFCHSEQMTDMGDRLPQVICEAVDPVLLGAKILDVSKNNIGTGQSGCDCCCEIPDAVLSCLSGCLCGTGKEKVLTVSLGIFSVLRIERPSQLMICATEYSVPDKICMTKNDEDPCAIFNKMAFPVSEFHCSASRPDNGCGC